MKKHVLAVLAAGTLWGTMGFFTRRLALIGIDTTGAILVRCAFAAALFALTLLVTDPKQFRVSPRHFWCFFGSGVWLHTTPMRVCQCPSARDRTICSGWVAGGPKNSAW